MIMDDENTPPETRREVRPNGSVRYRTAGRPRKIETESEWLRGVLAAAPQAIISFWYHKEQFWALPGQMHLPGTSAPESASSETGCRSIFEALPEVTTVDELMHHLRIEAKECQRYHNPMEVRLRRFVSHEMVNVNNVLSAQDIEQAIAAIIKEYEPPLKLPLWTRDDAEAAIAQATELDTFLNEVRTGMNHETNPQVLRRQQELLNCIRSERKNRIQRNAHP
jgi:hypothetical protein